jgi:hypothetical protein
MSATVTPSRPGVVIVERGVVQYAAPLTNEPAPRPCPVCGIVIDAHDVYWTVQRLRSRPTIRPEDTLHAAGIDDARQAKYQRRFSTLLAGRAKDGT